MEKEEKTKIKKIVKAVKADIPVSAKASVDKEKAEEKVIQGIEEIKAAAIPESEAGDFERISEIKTDRYFKGLGRRKTSVASVRLFTQGDKTFSINNKLCQEYFPTFELQQVASSSLKKMKAQERFRVVCIVNGGGIHSQAEAIRHGIARALIDFNPDFRKRLRRSGFLTRDPRARERKKFGLKRARRAPQWTKR
jgi:small subunit ribosomal protein S9